MKNLRKSFGAEAILDDISFQADDGELCVLLGPSGCGKSTLLRIVAGLETATSGSVLIGGVTVDSLPARERDVAFVFQNYALYPHMTVFDNLGFSLRLRGLSKHEIESRVVEAAHLLEIDQQLFYKPHQLSGGQRQRVALGRAIVRRPKIFLFDEPLSNLDATLRSTMRVELARLHQRLGATILYVTHDQAEAMTLGEKIIVLNQGKIQQIGTAEDIYHRPANAFVAGFVGTPRMNLIEGKLEDNSATFSSGALKMDMSKMDSRLPVGHRDQNLTLGIRPEHLTISEPSSAWFQGTVGLVENLGAEQLIYVDCNGVELIVRRNGKDSIEKGRPLYLAADASDVHLFVRGIRQSGSMP